MSVIVRMNAGRDGVGGDIVLYSKGADSVIYGLLDHQLSVEASSVTQDLLDQYARLGLRTLCLTKKVSSDTCTHYSIAGNFGAQVTQSRYCFIM